MKLGVAMARLTAIAVAAVFVYAGALKAWHPGQFYVDIERYRLLPDWGAWCAAAWLPYLEITAGAALLSPRMAAAGRMILAGLLVVFIGALFSAWARGLNVACGCFGSTAEAPNYGWWIGRDLLLLAALARLQVRRPASKRKPGPASAAPHAATALVER